MPFSPDKSGPLSPANDNQMQDEPGTPSIVNLLADLSIQTNKSDRCLPHGQVEVYKGEVDGEHGDAIMSPTHDIVPSRMSK